MAMDFSPRVGFHCRRSEGVCTACVQLPAVTSVCSLKTEALAAIPLFGDTETTHTKSTLKDSVVAHVAGELNIVTCIVHLNDNEKREEEEKKDMLLPLKEGCRGERKLWQRREKTGKLQNNTVITVLLTCPLERTLHSSQLTAVTVIIFPYHYAHTQR